MLQKKYIIMIGIVVCLFILYYFYEEIKSVKKLFIPTYQKTMALESRILTIEKKSLANDTKKKLQPPNDSPALTISYHSDKVKNGNLSIKYSDVSETEAKELLKKIDKNNNPNEYTDTINIKLQDIIKDKQDVNKIKKIIEVADFDIHENEEYNNILKGLDKDNDFNEDVIRSLTDSVKQCDIPTDNSISEIPNVNNSKVKLENKKSNAS